MARAAPDPFKVIDTGREAPLLWPMFAGQTARVHHWACLHCGHVDTEDRTFSDADRRARDHWYAKHLVPMTNRDRGPA